jgi:hypothetical protein
VSVYVSDEFKTVARRALGTLTGEEIAKACPPNKPLCPQVVKRLSDAFAAAIYQDDAGLQLALMGFFQDASVNALLEASSGGIFSDPTVAATTVAQPMVKCLSEVLTGKNGFHSCSVDEPLRASLAAAVKSLACKGNDCAVRDTVATKLATKGATMKPDDALVVLQIVVTDPKIDRPDLRIYLLKLRALFNLGITSSVFDPVFAFLAEEAPDLSLKAIVEFDPAAPLHALFTSALPTVSGAVTDSDIAGALAECKQAPEAFQEWQATRSAAFVTTLRDQLLTGSALDLGLVQRLLEYQPCAADTKEAIRTLKHHLRYFFTPLIVHDAMTRYALPVLSAAALVDYVRTRDETQLEHNLERAFLFGLAQTVVRYDTWQKLTASQQPGGAPVTAASLKTVQGAFSTCELQATAALFGVSLPVTLVVGASCEHVTGGPTGAIVAVAPNPTGLTRAQWLQANAPAILAAFEPVFTFISAHAKGVPFFEGIDTTTLVSVGQQLGSGDVRAAKLTMIRFGVDLLVDRISEFAQRIVGEGGMGCVDSANTTSIFFKTGATCAAYLLIQSAYRPIADYYWQYGISADDAPKIAKSVYRAMLASPYLDHTPLILNVGLGGTYIFGRKADWGDNGLAAVTVVDKIGLAFYKASYPKWQFETGIFAGGFLDALVRTVVRDGKEQRNWLLGYTVGWPRIGGLSLGVELHVAAAMPFQFSDRRPGFASGLALVLPYSIIFDNGGSK